MINGGRFGNSGRMNLFSIAMAVVAAGIILTLALPDDIGVQSGFNESSHALRPSGRHPVARVIAVSGPASAVRNGGLRPLAIGSCLEAGEVVVTGARSMVVVETAQGDVYSILPESRVGFRENRWMGLDRVDRWLSRIKTHIQRFGGPPPSDPLSSPTAVLAVRAAILLFSGSDATLFARRWTEMRS